jgi:hypothetical protein
MPLSTAKSGTWWDVWWRLEKEESMLSPYPHYWRRKIGARRPPPRPHTACTWPASDMATSRSDAIPYWTLACAEPETAVKRENVYLYVASPFKQPQVRHNVWRQVVCWRPFPNPAQFWPRLSRLRSGRPPPTRRPGYRPSLRRSIATLPQKIDLVSFNKYVATIILIRWRSHFSFTICSRLCSRSSA